MRISKIKGTLDYYGVEAKKYQYIERTADSICQIFGFEKIVTPIFETTELFARGVGEGSDIVNKEMYTFMDKSNRSLTLRPEGTASVTRAYVENKLYVTPGIHKFTYFGPMFRYERPQAGRLRQFTQFGVEVFGEGSSYMDAEVINMASMFLRKLKINNIKVLINTIGSFESRANYEKVLSEYFSNHINEMCEDCKNRLQKNPLRILDCKIDKNSDILNNAPKIFDYLSEDDKAYFKKVCIVLDELDIKYEVSSRLVRGLDYYTNTVFEFVYDDPSSKIDGLTLLAGGRYNGLASELEGPKTDAIGFACGVERIMMVMDELKVFDDFNTGADAIVITIGEACKLTGLKVANKLRQLNKYVEFDYLSNNLKPQFKLAERCHAKYIIIIGETEMQSGLYQVKDVAKGVEQMMTIHEIKDLLEKVK